MPELPDITVYVEALERLVRGQGLTGIRLGTPFLLRTVDPPISAAEGRHVLGVRRLGKRIVLHLEEDLFLALHLMIAGRLKWLPATGKAQGPKANARSTLAALDFTSGTLVLTEAGSKRRAALHLVRGEDALGLLDRGGIEPLAATREQFVDRLTSESHTVKRALTDPRLFAGIGNAYSDEILHRARLSPVTLTRRLSPEEMDRLYHATRDTLVEWTVRLRAETGDGFPQKVTAFREGMAVHGRYGKPCPVCGTSVQRIRYADNETNYCPRCQTEGRLLADRALSRLLHQDWPKTIEALEG